MRIKKTIPFSRGQRPMRVRALSSRVLWVRGLPSIIASYCSGVKPMSP